MGRDTEYIIFDLGGVIFDIDFSLSIKALSEKGICCSYDVFKEEQFVMLFQHYELGLFSDNEFRDHLRGYLAADLSDLEIDNIWNSTLIGVDPIKLECLKELTNKYIVYLLSNTNNIHWNFIVQYFKSKYAVNINNLFQNLFLSYKLHLSKPSTSIFQYVIDQEKLDANKVLFIDDKLENTTVADRMGFKTFKPSTNSSSWVNLFDKDFNLCK